MTAALQSTRRFGYNRSTALSTARKDPGSGLTRTQVYLRCGHTRNLGIPGSQVNPGLAGAPWEPPMVRKRTSLEKGRRLAIRAGHTEVANLVVVLPLNPPCKMCGLAVPELS